MKHTIFKFVGKLSILIIVAVVVIIAFYNRSDFTDISALQTMRGYFPLNATTKFATVCVTPTNVQNSWTVYLHQYDQNGKEISHQEQLVMGEQVLLQGALIDIQNSLVQNIAGLQSEYKLILLEGHFANTANKNATSIPLNGGEDAEFVKLQSNSSPVATASLDSPLQLKGDGKTYDLFATGNGLIPRPDPNPSIGCSNSFNH